MKINEYGGENPERILLIHPSLVTWDYFENVIPLLEKDYHLLIPVLPGYDLEDGSEFSSVEKVASQLADDLLNKGISEVKTIYGCSMGGSIALRMAADGKLKAQHYVMDGGITPYQLPWILTRLIALRDFGMMALGIYSAMPPLLMQSSFALPVTICFNVSFMVFEFWIIFYFHF